MESDRVPTGQASGRPALRSSGFPRSPLRSAALLLALGLLPLGFVSCGGSSTGPGNGNGDGPSVTVTPSAGTLDALGATVNLSASGTDASGQQIGDGDVNWSSLDEGVASVNGSGFVEALANGSARIVAALPDGSAADTAEITVDQVVAETRVQPASVELASLGDTVHFAASPVDANGFDVEDVTISWSSSDASVLEVDDAGVATAVDTGEAQAVATPSEGPEGRADVEVAQPDPVVDGVSPDTLEEGTTATITGQHFDPDPDANAVLVDGIPAPVTSASTTQIQITVPQFDCRPLRAGGLRVVVDDDSSDVAQVTIRPDEGTLSLAVGERRLIQDPAEDFCVQLDETGESQEFLVGVQSTTDAVGITTTLLALETGGASGSASVAAAAGGPKGEGRTPDESLGGPGRWQVDWLSGAPGRSPAEARLRRWEREHLGPRLESSIPRRWGAGGPPTAMSLSGAGVDGAGDADGASTASEPVPPLAAQLGSNPSEGDTVDLRVPDLNSAGTQTDNACTSYISIEAVVRKVGTHGVWLEDVDNPSGGFDDSDWQELSDQFDASIHPTDTDYFGETTDIDGNGRSAIVVSKELNELGGVLGFVFAGDLFPRSGSGTTCASSDEGELTYTLAPDPDGVHGDTVSTERLRHLYPNLIAHEFTHIIQFGERFQCSGCQFPVTWILEGQATLAEEVVGHAVTGRQTGQNYGFDVAFNPNDADFTDWYVDRFVDMALYYGFAGRRSDGSLLPQKEGAPEECSWLVASSDQPSWGGGPCLGGRDVYGVPSHLLRWINDHVGSGYPGGEQALQRDITANDDLGFDNLEEVTGEDMEDMLADWGAALWTDDRVSGVDARLTDPSWDLFDIFQNLPSTARLDPADRSVADFSDSFGVNAGSAAYFLIGGTGRPPTSIRARRPDGTPLPTYMQMWVIRTQ